MKRISIVFVLLASLARSAFAADWSALAAEIKVDPLGVGYASMTDQQVADSLNTVVSRQRPTINVDDLVNAIAFSEYPADQREREYIAMLFGNGNVLDVRPGTNVRTGLLAIFGAGTATRSNLAALVDFAIKRWEEIGWEPVGSGLDVTAAQVAAAKLR